MGLAGLILVVNAGSTTLKLNLVAADESVTPARSLDGLPAGIDAVAHRVVHGGDLREPVRIDGDVEERLRRAVELAPLHNKPAIEAIAEARSVLRHGNEFGGYRLIVECPPHKRHSP